MTMSVPAGELGTPYLRFDLDGLDRAYRAMRDALPEARVHYAMKCNPARPILARLRELGASFEIASAAELGELRAIGVPAAEVLFSNPVKVPAHVRQAWTAGVYRFAVDSDAELDKIASAAPGAAVYVRLATTAGGSAVPSEGKFGVGPGAAARLLRGARARGLRAYGITFHVGSQMTDPGAWADAIERCAAVMTGLRRTGIRLAMLDVGGGFPARYDSDVPDLRTYAKHIRTAIDRHVPYPVELVVEPGRALVAQAGVMVATVIGVARRGGARWAHLDVGAFNGFMEALETRTALRYPVCDSRDSPRRDSFHLTGPTCDSQDTVRYSVPLSADLAVGDRVYLQVAGAYTTAYASRFNGFDPPGLRFVCSAGAP
ncbi:ornithine decarboxylase [Krasilnikovia cinnamomea]|uniref:ornithine decarboxylase n=1 Tax=Krasilnikovia cinnamomea TaxID=349313 RepID=A0A4Q7ZDY3_9ACTN|nr:type III PLP-dependent enzyme [Krasilnikovia cinnamomea]RZU48900.1 ornithine decarboxylase [Krasilnikovia cinnamomea]